MNRILTLALIITAGAAFAVEPGAMPASAPNADTAALVKKYDTNKDGAISKEELTAVTTEADKKALTALDTNKDGAISKEELAAKPVTK